MHSKRGLIASLAALFFLTGITPAGAAGSPPGTPENGSIAFGRFDGTLHGTSLWTSQADGTHQERLTTDVTGFSDWSPDGSWIAFDYNDDTGTHIATISPNGQDRRSITIAPGVQEVPRWSPDGDLIAFDAFSFDQDPFEVAIWVMASDGSSPRQITTGAIDVEPVWSPDGEQLAFGRITGDSPQGQLEAIYVVNADGAELHEVVAPRAGLEHPDWSPTGLITFNVAPENPSAADSGSILAVRPNGKGLRVLWTPTHGFKFFKPVWSPDGRQLLAGCLDTSVGRERLCVLSAQGKSTVRVVVGGDTGVNLPSWGSR
jgi:TolB protein